MSALGDLFEDGWNDRNWPRPIAGPDTKPSTARRVRTVIRLQIRAVRRIRKLSETSHITTQGSLTVRRSLLCKAPDRVCAEYARTMKLTPELNEHETWCCQHDICCGVHSPPHDTQFVECTCGVGLGSIRHEYHWVRAGRDLVRELLAVVREQPSVRQPIRVHQHPLISKN
jgi:hypothetical protein